MLDTAEEIDQLRADLETANKKLEAFALYPSERETWLKRLAQSEADLAACRQALEQVKRILALPKLARYGIAFAETEAEVMEMYRQIDALLAARAAATEGA